MPKREDLVDLVQVAEDVPRDVGVERVAFVLHEQPGTGVRHDDRRGVLRAVPL